ncbi:ribosomal protein L7/L12 [Marinicaulis aureus]|uniref:Ribosomal protein L7/L12 n=1 Tax=Hyphococcus aureus TaxID=2666033 RepID=A0ABW1KVT9_9PROT
MFDFSMEQWLLIAFLAYVAFTIGRMSKSGEAPEAREARRMAEETRAADAFASLSPSIQSDVDRLLMDKKKIEAIKVIREHTGLGLKESKIAADKRASQILA